MFKISIQIREPPKDCQDCQCHTCFSSTICRISVLWSQGTTWLGPLLNSVPQIFEAKGPTKFQVHKPRISLENTHEFPVCNTKLPQMSIQKFPEKGGDARLQVMKVRPSLEKSQWNLGVPDSFLLEASSTYESSAISWLLQERQRLVLWKQIVGSNQSNGVEKALKNSKKLPQHSDVFGVSICFWGILKKKTSLAFSPPKTPPNRA